MQYIAYGNTAQCIEEKESIIDSLKNMKCPIFLDNDINNPRGEWKKFIDSLQQGDTAVVYSFTNSFLSYYDMIFFLKLCFMQNIRIISLADKLDTHDLLFPETRTQNILEVVCKIFQKRKETTTNSEKEYSQSKHEKKLKREKLIINMYTAGYSVKDIMNESRYKSKNSIFAILRKYNIDAAYPQMRRFANGVSSAKAKT